MANGEWVQTTDVWVLKRESTLPGFKPRWVTDTRRWDATQILMLRELHMSCLVT